MLNQIGQIRIVETDLGSPYTYGRLIRPYWDDSALSIRVFIYETNGTLVGEQSSGPVLSNRRHQVVLNYYKFCDSGDLNEFKLRLSGAAAYPYVDRIISENHWSCSLIVCDITFNVALTRVTGDSGASDGEITVYATTSYGAPRFSLDVNDNYEDATEPINNAYTFTGLAAGSYIVYAIDENQCRASLLVTVPEQEAVYGTRWRLEYDDIYSYGVSRVDIEEIDYSGSITEVCGGDDPFILSWENKSNRDIFETIIASKCEINLLSETDFQYIDLFTQDERKYRVKYYRNTGSGFNIKWTGYVLPSLYSEPYYTTSNYIVSITATDQIADLKDKEFLDDFGNPITGRLSVLDAILIILRKTDININVFENVNIFAEGMGNTYLNFSNPSFTDVMYPFININNGETGYNFQWQSGDFLQSAPSSGSYSGAPAISQTRPDSNENWPVGSYIITINASQSGASSGIQAKLYGFDDSSGTNSVDFGTIDTLDNGVGSAEYIAAINVTTAKKYLGLGFVRNGAAGLHTINVYDFNITQSPVFTYNSSVQQAFINTDVYYKSTGEYEDCDFVLNKLLISFGARVYQSDNYWRIELIEQKSASGDYRIFDINGVLQSNGNTYQLSTITRPTTDQYFINRSAILSILPSYGNISFKINLFNDNNLLQSGGFEETDIVENGFDGWSFDFTNGPGITANWEKLNKKNVDSLGALNVGFINSAAAGDYIIIKAAEFDLAPISGPTLVFSFDISVRPIYTDFSYRVDYSVKIGDDFMRKDIPIPNPSTVYLIDGEYNCSHIDGVNNWETVSQELRSIDYRFDDSTTELSGPVIVKIRLSNNKLYEYTSFSQLRALTSEYAVAIKRTRILDGNVIRFYDLEYTDDLTENVPDKIIPDGVIGSSGLVWILKKSIENPSDDFWNADSVLIDNVSLHFSDKQSTDNAIIVYRNLYSPFHNLSIPVVTPESITYTKLVDTNIVLDLEKDIIHIDAATTIEEIESPEELNSNLLRVINNHITLNNGVNTTYWGRSYTSGQTFTSSMEDIGDGENGGTGVDWTVSSTPNITLDIGQTSKYYLLDLTDTFSNVEYDFTITYSFSAPSAIDPARHTINIYLLDGSLTVLDSDFRNKSIQATVVISTSLISTTSDPVYLGIEVVIPSNGQNDTLITLTDATISEEQLTGNESRSLANILMLMYQGQLSSPSYRLSGSFLTTSEASFFNTFDVEYINKLFVPSYMSIHDKSRIIDGELAELKTGDNGLPPATIYEFTDEFTTEFDA